MPPDAEEDPVVRQFRASLPLLRSHVRGMVPMLVVVYSLLPDGSHGPPLELFLPQEPGREAAQRASRPKRRPARAREDGQFHDQRKAACRLLDACRRLGGGTREEIAAAARLPLDRYTRQVFTRLKSSGRLAVATPREFGGPERLRVPDPGPGT